MTHNEGNSARLISRMFADAIFVVHAGVVFVALFGWIWPDFWPLYMAVLIGTLVSDILLGYCILSKWEFDIRKRLNPSVDYDFTFSSYYTHTLTRQRLRNEFVLRIAYIFLPASILLGFLTHFAMGPFA